jgi:imidazolonepropionase-like amidohydrolase
MDLQYLVKYAGMTPMETLVAATRYGGEVMMMGDQLGLLKEGYLADLLLVDGDPLADLSILVDKRNLLAIMKDGEFFKQPEVRAAAAGRWPLSAA